MEDILQFYLQSQIAYRRGCDDIEDYKCCGEESLRERAGFDFAHSLQFGLNALMIDAGLIANQSMEYNMVLLFRVLDRHYALGYDFEKDVRLGCYEIETYLPVDKYPSSTHIGFSNIRSIAIASHKVLDACAKIFKQSLIFDIELPTEVFQDIEGLKNSEDTYVII